MIEFQLLDTDYILVDEKPIIRLFGKTASGESVCGFYEGFKPYFYANDIEKTKELLKNESNVVKIEEVEKTSVDGYQQSKKVLKITLQNPAKTVDLREKLHSAGIRTFESDILFKYRFMCDMDIAGHDWIRVTEGNPVSTGTVSTKNTINIKKMKIDKREENAPLKYMAIDIECVPTRSGTMPEAKRDPVIMISVSLNEPYKGEKNFVLATRKGNGATFIDNEKEMLQELLKTITEYDPDVLTGYNINSFDIPYLLERMTFNKIKPVFGRCKQKSTMTRKLMNRHRNSIVGRVIVDSFEIIKKDFSLMRYGLDFVAHSLLGEEKGDVKKSEIEKLWRGSQEEYERLVSYSQKDAVLALDLVLKLNLMDKYIALSRVSGVVLNDSLGSGETTRIENFLLREFNKQNFIYSFKPNQREVAERDRRKKVELKGGFVIEPIKKLHSSVLVLDFKSMYPSIIRSFNICPTTILPDNVSFNDELRTVGGARFAPPEIRKGIAPKILEELMKRRGQVKRKMKNASGEKKRVLFANQWALKIMANAFYGHMGYPRAKIYNLDIANAITSTGRDTIQKTKKIIEDKYKLKVVYGDTDSVMIKANTDDMEEIKKIGTKIAKEITEDLPGVIELEFEKVYKQFLPLTKKRYMSWKFEATPDGWKDNIETKGIETVRRDWCPLVSETTSTIIDIILKKNDIKGAVKHFRETAKELADGNIDIQKLLVTKTLTRHPEKYAGMQPHAELVKKIRARNPAESPGVGDRVGYVIVKGIGLLSKRAEDPDYIIERGLQVDSQYYIENQLLPPLERIFSALDISKSELMGKGKQMSLFDVARFNGNGNTTSQEQQTKPPEEPKVRIEVVNGFICKSCNNSYEITPLLGRCSCGGDLLLSSPQGPVSKAIVM